MVVALLDPRLYFLSSHVKQKQRKRHMELGVCIIGMGNVYYSNKLKLHLGRE